MLFIRSLFVFCTVTSQQEPDYLSHSIVMKQFNLYYFCMYIANIFGINTDTYTIYYADTVVLFLSTYYVVLVLVLGIAYNMYNAQIRMLFAS
jgi:hypothetical protein